MIGLLRIKRASGNLVLHAIISLLGSGIRHGPACIMQSLRSSIKATSKSMALQLDEPTGLHSRGAALDDLEDAFGCNDSIATLCTFICCNGISGRNAGSDHTQKSRQTAVLRRCRQHNLPL